MCLLAIWIAARPYRGLFDDAWLYSIQGLSHLEPGRFSQDLFFIHGSQDAFSAFSPLFARLIEWFGVGGANLVGALLGEVACVAAAIFLVQTVLKAPLERVFVLAAVFGLSCHYAANGITSYGEPFMTPRPYAEALSLFALAFAARRRLVICAVLLVLAIAVHPVVTVVPIAFLAVLAALKDRRIWIVLLGAGLAVVALGLFHLGPFGRAMATFDPAWWAVVRERSGHAVVSRWAWWDFAAVASTLFMLGVGRAVAHDRERRWLTAMLIVYAGGLTATAVGGDFLRNVLIVDAQPWRVLWLATVMANAVLVALVLRAPGVGFSRHLLVAAAVTNFISGFVDSGAMVAPIPTLLATAAFALESRWGLPRMAKIGFIASFGLCWAVLAEFAWLGAMRGFYREIDLARALAGCAALGVLILVQRRGVRPLAAATAFIALGASAASAFVVPRWDQFVLSPASAPGLAAFVPPGNVYWEGDGLEVLWFKLGRPSYYSCLQGTGVMFYRGTAIDYRRRQGALRTLNSVDFDADDRAEDACGTKAQPNQTGPRDMTQIAAACRELPDLDTIILNAKVDGAAAAQWTAPTSIDETQRGRRASTFYRYDCAALRSMSSPQPAGGKAGQVSLISAPSKTAMSPK